MPIGFYEIDTIEEIWRQDGYIQISSKTGLSIARPKALSFAFVVYVTGGEAPSQANSRRL